MCSRLIQNVSVHLINQYLRGNHYLYFFHRERCTQQATSYTVPGQHGHDYLVGLQANIRTNYIIMNLKLKQFNKNCNIGHICHSVVPGLKLSLKNIRSVVGVACRHRIQNQLSARILNLNNSTRNIAVDNQCTTRRINGSRLIKIAKYIYE